MLSPLALLFVCAHFLFGCADKGTDADELFREKIQPIFEEECTDGCHVEEGYNPDLLLGMQYGQELLVRVPSTQSALNLVEPGSLEKSYLWHKLSDTHLEVGGSGDRMPFNWPLEREKFDAIEEYILALGE